MVFAIALFSKESTYLSAMCTSNLRHLWWGSIPIDALPPLLGNCDRLIVRKTLPVDYHEAAQLVRKFNAA